MFSNRQYRQSIGKVSALKNLSLKKKALSKKESFSFSTGFLFVKKKKCEVRL